MSDIESEVRPACAMRVRVVAAIVADVVEELFASLHFELPREWRGWICP